MEKGEPRKKIVLKKEQKGWGAIVIGIAIPVVAASLTWHTWIPIYASSVIGSSIAAICYGTNKLKTEGRY